MSVPAQAQVPMPTPTPSALPTPVVTYSDPNIVTFSQLKQNEFELIGPFDSHTFSFAIPASWSLKPGAQLDLAIGISFSTIVQGQNNPVVVGGGTLTISLNNLIVDVLTLNQVGEYETNITIPPEALISKDIAGRMQINFSLNADVSCTANQHTSIVIHPNSHFTLPHDPIIPDTNLANFPRPLYQNAFIPDTAVLVIPDQPTSSELQAALTVAAGLSKLSGNGLALTLNTLSQLTPQLVAATNLIFVGKAASLPTLAQVQLPLPETGGQFQVAGGSPDDGVIQMIGSPWSTSHVLLAVTGNSDAATIKAAQAISTGILRTNRVPNLSIVQQVDTTPVAIPQATDQTLSNLGSGGVYFEQRGENNASFSFSVPPGYTVTSDAYFELAFGHSALLNYDQSGIVVRLNNRAIGSVRMSDTTANQTTNLVKFQIPVSALLSGSNRLDISAILIPNDVCTPPTTRGLWVNIWPQSVLHLPLGTTLTSPVTNYNLGSFPQFFTYNPVLSDTAFLLAHNDLASWQQAMQLAAFLGNNTNGVLTGLNAFYADDMSSADKAKYNLLLVGHPSQMPATMSQLNSALPGPFSTTNDIAKEKNFQVTYLISPDSPLGYIELAISPWNSDRVAMAVLGNGAQGVAWATTSLIDPNLNWQIKGNFVAVNKRQMVATDTRINSSNSNIEGVSPQSPNINVVATSVSPSLPFAQSQSWILVVLVISIILIALLLGIVAIQSWSNNRIRVGPKSTNHVTGGSLSLFGSLRQSFIGFLEKLGIHRGNNE